MSHLDHDPLELRRRVLLSGMRALCGEVRRELIGMTVNWSETGIFAVLYYDRPIDDELLENCQVIETEVMADFVPDVAVRFEPRWVKTDNEAEVLQEWIFLRKDPETY